MGTAFDAMLAYIGDDGRTWLSGNVCQATGGTGTCTQNSFAGVDGRGLFGLWTAGHTITAVLIAARLSTDQANEVFAARRSFFCSPRPGGVAGCDRDSPILWDRVQVRVDIPLEWTITP